MGGAKQLARFLVLGILVVVVSLFSLNSTAQNTVANNITFDAQQYSSNFDTHEMNLKGEVRISHEDKTLKADQVFLKTDEGTIRAEGNVVFSQGKFSIRGDKVTLNLKSGLGTFTNAVLSVEGGLYVEALELNRIDEDRYSAIHGKVSTCQGCPQAWSVTGSSMDVQVEGYAEVHNALFQIRDAPVAYFPIFYFPVKTKRQSGFLLPQYANSDALGSQVSQPYYWVIDENSDSTFEYRYLTKGGHRIWNELRWLQSDRSYLRTESSLLRNDLVPNVPATRYGVYVDQRYQLNPKLTQRFRGELASDRIYTSHFEKDFKSSKLPTLVNEPSLSWQDSSQYSYALLRFHRNNLPRAPVGDANNKGSINNWPELGYSLASFSLFGPIRGSADLFHMGFKRKSAALDPGTNWVRTGDRSSAIIKASAPMNIGDFMDWDPRVEIRADNYLFDAKNVDASAQRAKIFVDQRLSSTFWRVYKTDYPELKALRHSMTPLLRWSFTPPEIKNDHPFFDVEENPRFDIFDPNPLPPGSGLGTFNEEQRLKPHNILTVGANTRMVGRYGEESRFYREHIGASVERDFDLRESRFGRLRIGAFGAFGGGRVATEIAVNTKTGDSDMRNEAAFAHRYFSANIYQRVGKNEETYGYGATLSFLGPFRLRWSEVYNSIVARVIEEDYVLDYNSPSKCWFFSFAMSRRHPHPYDYSPSIRFTVSEAAKGSKL